MHKLFLFPLTVLLFSCNSDKQNRNSSPNDSSDIADKRNYARAYFAKCSYVLFLKGTGRSRAPDDGYATGFFVKRSGRTFLISNYHVFTSTDTRTKKANMFQVDSIILIYQTVSGPRQLGLDLKMVRGENAPIYDYERADVFAYDVTNLLKKDGIIYSVEQYMKPISAKTRPSHIFASSLNEKNVAVSKTWELHLIDTAFDGYQYKYNNVLHFVNNSYIATPASSHGMSGSPVFFELNNNPDSIVFGGLVSSHYDTPVALTILVKPEEVEKELQRRISNK